SLRERRIRGRGIDRSRVRWRSDLAFYGAAGFRNDDPYPHKEATMKTLVTAAVLVAALVGVSRADQVYDGIAYPPGLLAGHGPAQGFAAAWLADPGVLVTPAGLSSPLD